MINRKTVSNELYYDENKKKKIFKQISSWSSILRFESSFLQIKSCCDFWLYFVFFFDKKKYECHKCFNTFDWLWNVQKSRNELLRFKFSVFFSISSKIFPFVFFFSFFNVNSTTRWKILSKLRQFSIFNSKFRIFQFIDSKSDQFPKWRVFCTEIGQFFLLLLHFYFSFSIFF